MPQTHRSTVASYGLCSASLISLMLSTGACTSWQVQRVSPREVVESRQPKALRVTRLDSSQIVLRAPHIVGNSLVDGSGGVAPRGEVDSGRGVPLADVKQTAIRRVDFLKTFGLAAFIGGVTLAVGAIAVDNALDDAFSNR